VEIVQRHDAMYRNFEDTARDNQKRILSENDAIQRSTTRSVQNRRVQTHLITIFEAKMRLTDS